MDNIFQDKPPKTVFISEEQFASRQCGTIFGRYFEQTNIYNIFPAGMEACGDPLGEVLPSGSEPGDAELCGILTDAGIAFYSRGDKLNVETYGIRQNIFSRNKGILESDVMAAKRVVLLGCGSVGSLVALELARAGVEHFYLIDPDIMEYHNICRHQCGIEDVGDLKIHAIARKLKNINPQIEVSSFEGIVQNAPKAELDAFCVPHETIFVGCADNRAADVYANRISIYYKASFISIGFWERAHAGEIFYHQIDRNTPCYQCALGEGGEISARSQANHHVYSNQESTEGVKFEPGISVDIHYITSIGIKLILDLLNASNPGYIPRLLNELKPYTIVCNTSNPAIGGEMVEIFSYPLQVSTSLVVQFGKQCPGQCKHETAMNQQ